MKFKSIIAMTAAVAVALVPSLTLAQSKCDLWLQNEASDLESDAPIHNTKSATLSILTNNVYFLSPLIYPNWGQVTRAGLISNSDYIKNHDVIILQECFHNTACDVIRSGLASQYPYQTSTVGRSNSKSEWDSTFGYYSNRALGNGGVTILSKWPIKQKHQYIYKDGCGYDNNANKGFAYVILDYKGTNIHVFGTHMQSDDPKCTSGLPAWYRRVALDQMRKYIVNRRIPVNELVIMAGDFNIKKDSPEFTGLLSRLSAAQPTKYEGHPWTWDTLDNSIAKYNYPDTVKEPPQYIDYVFTQAKHSAGVRSSVQTSLRVKSSPYVLDGCTYNDYSDHYPVITKIHVDL
ncbi:Sphingomyelinase [Linnemannia elongata]|nr:Sphingomyelinase [Linnemannia elongata]